MWDEPFSTEMLTDGAEIAVNCPDEDLERELAAILTAFGCTYPSGGSILNRKNNWKDYKEDFCYYIDKTHTVRYGPKSSTRDTPWSRYRKCTFYGEQREDISEERFNAIIGRL